VPGRIHVGNRHHRSGPIVTALSGILLMGR
jgi:hypothetical protein